MEPTARLWIDCEWNQKENVAETGDLISMALVGEDDAVVFYEVLPCENPEPWVKENVMPILNKRPVSYQTFRQRLGEFLARFAGPVEICADHPTDIKWFCEVIVGRKGRCIGGRAVSFKVGGLYNGRSALPHNALMDAMGNREATIARENRLTT